MMEPTNAEEEMFLPSILLAFICILGIFGNTQIVYVTVKYKFLHNRCNILMAILAVADIFHQLAPFPLVYFVFTRNLFISQSACFYIQLVPAFFTLHSVTVILAVGIDRMFCVFFPMRYQSFNRTKSYIAFLTFLGLIYSLGMVFYSFFQLETHANDQVICSVVSFFAGSSVSFWIFSSITMILLTVVMYMLIWHKLISRNGMSESRKLVMKPLTVMVALFVFGWVLGMSIRPIGSFLGLSEADLGILSTYGGLGPNIAVAVNYFVYGKFNSEYRRAFSLVWKKPITTTHVPPTMRNNSQTNSFTTKNQQKRDIA